MLPFELPLPLQSGVGRRLPHAFWLPLAAFYYLCHKRERYEGSADRRNGSMNGPRFPLPKMAILRAVLSSEGTEWLWKLQSLQWRGTRTEGYKPAALTLGSGLDLQLSRQCRISSGLSLNNPSGLIRLLSRSVYPNNRMTPENLFLSFNLICCVNAEWRCLPMPWFYSLYKYFCIHHVKHFRIRPLSFLWFH